MFRLVCARSSINPHQLGWNRSLSSKLENRLPQIHEPQQRHHHLAKIDAQLIEWMHQEECRGEGTNPSEALRRIHETRRNNARVLPLLDLNLHTLPPSLGYLPCVETIHLSCNRLRKLPEYFGEMPNLQYINASSNELCKLPTSLKSYPRLKGLCVEHNRIHEIPPSLKSEPLLIQKRFNLLTWRERWSNFLARQKRLKS